MPERDMLLASLVAEVLGPRQGTHETLRPDEDPADEYITGVLAPYEAESAELDAQADLLGEDDVAADDQADVGKADPGSGPAALRLPPLDHRARPASMGLSFAMTGGGSPMVDICATWARYRPAGDGAWRRVPMGRVWEAIDCSRQSSFVPESDEGIRIQIRARQEATRWRISVFLLNATRSEHEFPRAETHVFQPQIRIRCGEGWELVALDIPAPASEDEQRATDFLYRERRGLARGHLCSAVWREIDPERPHPSIESPDVPGFHWSDGADLFDQATYERFSPADARTEFVPMVPVNAPDRSWSCADPPPELDPEVLSEAWSPDEIRAALDPLTDGYSNWLGEQEAAILALPPGESEVGRSQLARGRAALARMRAGIRMLETDEDVRLAFCFANRAIAIQSAWTKGRVNAWWPFQLAFHLINLPALTHSDHPDRGICDLLWFPTGGGKTEAYLGLAAFTFAFRRLRARRSGLSYGGEGVALISRYTLRLLTIQQFRRALALVTACEFLRVIRHGTLRGWRPRACHDDGDPLWGDSRFAVGLWVGGGVTPNGHHDFQYRDRRGRLVTEYGAISILEGTGEGQGEPAQVLVCPSCQSTLAVPPEGYQRDQEAVLHLVLGDAAAQNAPAPAQLSTSLFNVAGAERTPHDNPRFCTLTIRFSASEDAAPHAVDSWFRDVIRQAMGPETWLVPARASRPGYFVRVAEWGVRRARARPYEFELFCPNPECQLNTSIGWWETTPTGEWPVLEAFRGPSGECTHCPVPAWTVDEQVYHRCPSMVVATVDKFARLSFEPKAGGLFGKVERFNEYLGYYRGGCAPNGPGSPPARPRDDVLSGRNVETGPFAPPDFILQDELHLIEGPLGSLVGIYETAVDALASHLQNGEAVRPKYIASTATVRNAQEQVQSLFDRQLEVFPAPGLTANDSFFSTTRTSHPLDAHQAGRLYVGVCAPGRGAQTPIVRIWSRLLQRVADRASAGASADELDAFWTLVGYFNAIRELAGAVALARQDIVQRIETIATRPRALEDPMELSSRADSMQLPGMLEHLSVSLPAPPAPADSVVATSMFGTGVDVERLGLMVVHGQPKTTSAYIQATGRVGRLRGGLVVTFFRAARPRDLSHYEFFATYHAALYRHVEPVTVSPFAPRARDRALGPVAVAILRQASELILGGAPVPVNGRWRTQQRLQGGWSCRAHEMASARADPDVLAVPEIMELRSRAQPDPRRPGPNETRDHSASEIDRWSQLAGRAADQLLYFEPTLVNPASRPIVLGDLAHLVARLGVAFEDAPNSLREVEATTTFRGWW